MGRLKGIPSILSPDILHLLAVTGHGDVIVLADINFPTRSICTGGPKEYRADGLGTPQLLEAILTLMPLDKYQDKSVALMEQVPSDKAKGVGSNIVKEFKTICGKNDVDENGIDFVERFEFYNQAKKAFAIIQTGETTPYGNILLKRGVC